MQHGQWQDLIPFYVAQTLTEEEKHDFEEHLATCVQCRQALSEWRIIAGVVWNQTDSVARSLPPLSPELYNRLSYRDRKPGSSLSANPPRPGHAPPSARPLATRKWGIPAGAVAGLIITLFLGAFLLLSFVRPREETEQQLVAQLSTSTDEAFAALDPGTGDSQITPTQLKTDFGIIPVPTQTSTPSRPAISVTQITPIQLPLSQPDPALAVPGGGGGNGIGAEGFTEAILAPEPTPDLCTAYNEGTLPLNLYRSASASSDVVSSLAPGQSAWASVISAEGWYQLIEVGVGVLGWASPESIVLRGPCNVVPVATPTHAPSAGDMIMLTGFNVAIRVPFADIRQEPRSNAAVLTLAQFGRTFPTFGYIDDVTQRWYGISLDGMPGMAWVNGTSVQLIDGALVTPTMTPTNTAP